MTTVELIDSMVEADDGRLFRKHLKESTLALTDAFDAEEHPAGGRPHLGASMIGDPCLRKLWYNFRLAGQKGIPHSGRILRLFNRGHVEEARFEAMLKMIGCELWTHDAAGKQFRFADIGGHFGGSLDSVVRGIPEMPKVPLLAEYKTHNDKSFTKLAANGVYASKETHYAQMQVYMHYMNLTHGIYLAVNKNTDELYSEIVPHRKEFALQLIDKARTVITSRHAPKRINENPGWWLCRFCDFYKACFSDAKFELTAKLCRCCSRVEATEQGWLCNKSTMNVQPCPDNGVCAHWSAHMDLV